MNNFNGIQDILRRLNEICFIENSSELILIYLFDLERLNKLKNFFSFLFTDYEFIFTLLNLVNKTVDEKKFYYFYHKIVKKTFTALYNLLNQRIDKALIENIINSKVLELVITKIKFYILGGEKYKGK